MSTPPHEPLFFADQPSDADWNAIGRFVAGESDAAEAQAVTAWLAAHPVDALLVQRVKDRSARLEARADVPVDTERALAAVRAQIAADSAAMVAPTLRVTRSDVPRGTTPSALGTRWKTRWVGFAAAAGLAAIVLTQLRTGATESRSPQAYRTAVGERDSIRLSDGSTVVLAPGSRLTVAAGFGARARVVSLDGAAYFDVKHDDAMPFIVRTADADIRDVGTAFTVKTAADRSVAVQVTHGIVELIARQRASNGGATDMPAPVELRAGDRGVLMARTVTVSRGVVTAADVAWTRGELSYRDASLAEVQADVRRWYGIELRVTDSVLARRTLTANFRSDSVSQVIRVIALALGAEAVQRGDTVVLQPLGNGHSLTP